MNTVTFSTYCEKLREYRIGDELCDFVTEVFLQHGAPAEIAWKQKPHVGTDLLRGVITSIRKEIESLGGEVHFNTALTGLERKNGRLVGITTTNGSFACETLVFAVGHSARDTFSMLMDSGLVLECKPFSVGFRAEHLQTEIEKSLYHEAAGHPALPRGEYQLSQHVGDRCVYTFCMCPGGQVVASASEEERVVTNGMSYHARSGKNANAAVVVSVGGADFAPAAPLPSNGSWKQRPTPPVVPPGLTLPRRRMCKAFWKGAGSCILAACSPPTTAA